MFGQKLSAIYIVLCIFYHCIATSHAYQSWTVHEDAMSTTSTTYQDIVSHVVDIDDASDFNVDWNAEMTASTLASCVEIRLLFNNTDVWNEQTVNPSSGHWVYAGGMVPFVTVGPGQHTWTIQYRSCTLLQSVSVRRVRLHVSNP